MKIDLVKREDGAELILDGRLDTNTSPEVDVVFGNVVERFDKIVLNLEKLEYISSAGLRTIKKLHVNVKKRNGRLTLKNANKMVMEVFEMTGFAGLFCFE